MSSILSRVVQLQVAPRGLRKANAVKVERAKANNLDNTSSGKSHVARCSRAVRVTISEHCQSGKMKVERAKSKEQRAKMKDESSCKRARVKFT